MSAITYINRELGPDGIRRYRTRWKILIHSHQYPGVTNLSNSVVNISLTKNIKSVGTCSFAVTGERNLLNLVYPNDYINVYCDRADGLGWTRVFFGFVDHLEELRRVDAVSGKPTTIYTVQCSDFQKALERTQIYFNPHLGGRRDFDGVFDGTANIGGAALRSRGLRVSGGPAELVTNTVLLLLGFGAQFILPTSYNPRVRDRIRQRRAEEILNTLPEDVRNAINNQGGYANYLENIRNQLGIEAPVASLVNPDDSTAEGVTRADRTRFSNEAIRSLAPGSSTAQENNGAETERGAEAYNILNTTLSGYPPTLLDIIDISTFLERQAIDGFTQAMSMWERQDNVMSFLHSISNEIVNELFFDLRAVSRDGGLTAGTGFSTEPDDLSGNIADSEGGTAGMLYQPALVMREYPFSTINRVDASNVPLTVRSRSVTGEPDSPETETIGDLWFGAIFSNRPNTPGRHVITIPGINIADLRNGTSTAAAPKHLDVAVVNDAEILTTRLSRSDTDHFNLFEIRSDGFLGEDSRFFLMDLLPIVTPIHVVRHGLRTRTLSTRFARFSYSTINRTQAPTSQAEAEESAPAAPEAPAPAPSITVLPVELLPEPGSSDRYTQGFVTPGNQWWYRRKAFDGSRRINNQPSNPRPASGVRYWRFHNGVDIQAARGTPVRAVRDGKVVMAAPVGTRGRTGYGNVVMIYHEADDVYSLYAHLDSIATNLQATSRSSRLASFASERIIRGGRYREVDVRAGDQIGTVGSTDCEGVHLHFEFDVVRNGRVYPSNSDRVNLTQDYFSDEATATAGFPVSNDRPANPSESLTISQDPVRVFRERWGKVLPVGASAADAASPALDPPPEATFPGDEAEFPDLPEVPVAPTEQRTEPDPGESTTREYFPGQVDTPDTRRALARWALLNDHWYQHNLEYLSGSIEMRGAPEIRVGYRLDLPDRNMSFYVEGVAHNWSYGQPMTTTLHVTRGQPSNPYPVYVLPFLNTFNATSTQRTTNSRLAAFFISPDPLSVRRSLKIQRRATDDPSAQVQSAVARAGEDINEVDTKGTTGWWAGTGEEQSVGTRYNEAVIEASTAEVDAEFERQMRSAFEQQQISNEKSLGLRGSESILATGAEGNPQASHNVSSLVEILNPFNIGDVD